MTVAQNPMLLYFKCVTILRLRKPAGWPTWLKLAACYSNAFKVMVTKNSNVGYWLGLCVKVRNLAKWIVKVNRREVLTNFRGLRRRRQTGRRCFTWINRLVVCHRSVLRICCSLIIYRSFQKTKMLGLGAGRVQLLISGAQ